MHIPVGKYEGCKIADAPHRGPMTPRELTIKEEIFDIIGTRIIGANVLDINDANGLCGIESLSRGAKKVTFVGTNEDSNKSIESNLKQVGVKKGATITGQSVEGYFKSLNKDEKYSVIFFEVERQEEVGAEAEMVHHLTENGLIIMLVPMMGGFQVPVAVEGACIQETRDCEQRIVMVLAKECETK